MSNGKKQQKKRKHHSSPFKSQIAVRLEKLRGRQRDLWGDDDDDNNKKFKKSKIIILSDSDEERPSSKRQSRKKSSQNHVKNPTCLICSILSQLSSHNCCSEHLSILKNHSHHPNSEWLPEQVMILPITSEIVQRYLDPQQIHHLRTQTSTTLTRKSLNKSTMTLDLSESQQQLATKSPQKDLPPLASTIVVESARSKSATIPPDITTASVDSTIIDIDQSSIQTITIDDTQEENILIKPVNDPWIPISDEIDAALEQVLDHIDSSFDTPLEFTPTTVRRTETEFMAARLPKIPLKEGRFRQGRPILNCTTSNAANEYRPLAAAQSSPLTTSIRSPPTTTNIENPIDNLNDNIFTQDEINQLPTTTQTNDPEIAINRSNETERVTSSTNKEKTTLSRMSFRLNPDGTRVSISRPALPTNHPSPLLSSLRRTSTDVSPISKQV